MTDPKHTHFFAGGITLSPEKGSAVVPALKATLPEQSLPVPQSRFFAAKPFVRCEHYSLFIAGSIFPKDAEGSAPREPLVASLYKQYGPSFPSHLEGYFFIILFDHTTQECIFFNNRYQATSFYYYVDNDLFVFASSLRLLLTLLPFKPEFDVRSIPSFLHTGFSSTEHTQFKNVYRLLPTYRIQIHKGMVTHAHHWQTEFVFDRRPFHDLEEHLDTYERLFEKSIDRIIRTYGTKELGCFLSGGHDTSFIYLKAQQLFKRPVHTFTASFDDFGFDEAPKARYLTEKFGGHHHRVAIGKEALDNIPLMVRLVEEPVPGGGLPIFSCCRAAAEHVDTLLSGDAGDTLWGEYYPVAEWHRYFHSMPYVLRRFAHWLNKAVLKVNDWERLWESEHVFSLFAEKDMYHDFFNRLCTYRHYNDDALRALLDPAVYASGKAHTCMLDIPFTRKTMYDALVEAKMFYGVYQYMLPPTQKPLEGLGVNFYPPYFDHDIISFINLLPAEWLNGGTTFQKLINDAHKRRFHKQVLLRYLPERYVYSVQQSLDVPFHAFMTKRPYVLENLLRRLKKRGWYNNVTLDRLFREFPKQEVKPHEIIQLKHHGYRIFCLLSLEVWCMEFMDPPAVAQTTDLNIVPLQDYLAL